MVVASVLGVGRAPAGAVRVRMVRVNARVVGTSLFKPQYTMAAVIANEFSEAADELYLYALIEIGLLLFIITIFVNIVSRLLIWSTKRRTTTVFALTAPAQEEAAAA